MLLSQQRNQVHKKWRELANKMWIRGLHLWFIALLSKLKPAMVASSVHSERLEVFQDFLCWRWGEHFCWNLQHQLKGGASIKTMWLDVGRYPHNWKCRVAFMSINEQMALCYRAGLFLLLLLLLHLFYTSFCFIRLPLTGSDYPQSLNPVREASCLAWKCQLAIYSSSSSLSLSNTPWSEPFCVWVEVLACYMFYEGLHRDRFGDFGGPAGEMCVGVRDHCEPCHVLRQLGRTSTLC